MRGSDNLNTKYLNDIIKLKLRDGPFALHDYLKLSRRPQHTSTLRTSKQPPPIQDISDGIRHPLTCGSRSGTRLLMLLPCNDKPSMLAMGIMILQHFLS
ncbi:hypothetical protein J6590_083452 [Homalodisca vitripennis]|nr:hypothetical protein J6590_083452 [Homalodisca vitripennis]